MNTVETKTYRCGTLSYTKKGLVVLFAWLLWGDFCFTMMEAVVPSIVPLKLKELGASSSFIGLMMSTLPGIFNTTICPWVSFKSDRHRGKWGRRMPFIIYTMPFLVLSLLFIGFSDQLGGWLHGLFLSGGTITRSTVIIGLLAIFLGMFDLFNMFVGSVYHCLFNDVVPREFIGKFMGWFRLVGVLSSAGYQYFIFKYALSHMTEIYVGAGLLYLVGFGAMFLNVKEGTYPPPDDDGEAPSLKKDIKAFSKNCFTIPYYWNIFITTTCTSLAGTVMVFMVFFQQSMGLDLGMIGKATAINSVIIAVLLLFAGVLVDRCNPVRTQAYVHGFNLCMPIFASVWIFADAPSPLVYFWVFVGLNVADALATAMSQCSTIPRLMSMFPSSRFGQFCGAQSLVRSGAVMLGGFLAGVYLDVMKGYFPNDDTMAYKFIHPWVFVFLLIGYIFHYRAFRYWKRLGGSEGEAPTSHIKYCELPESRSSPTDKILVGVTFMAFLGYFGACLFFMYYFQYQIPNSKNVFIFGILALIMTCFYLGFLRFVKYMERA